MATHQRTVVAASQPVAHLADPFTACLFQPSVVGEHTGLSTVGASVDPSFFYSLSLQSSSWNASILLSACQARQRLHLHPSRSREYICVCACCLWIQVQGVGTCLSIVGTALHSTTSSCVTVTKVPQVLLLLVNSTPSTELELAAVSNSKRGSPSTSRSFLSSQSKQRRLTPTNKQLDRSQQSCMTWDTIL
jgi:hypothetical protein